MRYEYKCPKCGSAIVVTTSYKLLDKEVYYCSSCNTKLKRQMSKTTFILKGSGWAKDGYNK